MHLRHRIGRRVATLAALLGLVAALWTPPAAASPTEIVKVRFERRGERWSVSVTLRHADTGWDHYANLWVVETAEGKELGRRVLYHPHVTEQPFTRSTTLSLPPGVTRVRVRAGDNLDGLNSEPVLVDLTRGEGPRYEVR